MIVLGGSSIHKGGNSWHAARAVSCLPALAGSYGTAGGGLGSRHAALAHGGGFATIAAAERRPPGRYVPNQMSEITAALADGQVRVLLLFGTNMTSAKACVAGADHSERRKSAQADSFCLTTFSHS